ncbi:oxygenase MpaB family protein [Nocardia asteroides]|uniref:oxygenase MpaB family protein n=1 Tax=Nocardia asteroides TaxID=1824 RepID=UPI001E30CFC6|nr:oxygenase MpaB family protein [Nocardia asteroides]UGT63634.1 oxygenase MpaB family protein [Nocardia asteroides]
MNSLRHSILSTMENIGGRHDDPAVYGGPAGDPGLCGPDSVSWKIHSDLASVMGAATGAIVMELLHPSVMAGVSQMSNYREDPFRRARTTLGYVLTTTFGNTDAATGLIEQVKRIHGYINGTRPDGTPFDALDPTLLTWVHICIPWMILRSYERYRAPLTTAEKNRYLAEQAVIGRMGGGRDVPESMAELQDYVEAMRPHLAVTEQTLEFFEFLMTAPLLPVRAPGPLDRALHAYVAHAGMSLTPEWVQRLTGFHHSQPVHNLLFAPYLHGNPALTRWVVGEPPYYRLAKARATGAPAPRTAAAAPIGR